MRRAWWLGLLVIAAFLMGCADGGARDSGAAAGGFGAEPTPVPWQRAEWTYHTPTPTTTPDTTGIPPCDARDLVVRFANTSAATGGQLLAYFSIDGPRSACVLSGPISVEIVTPSGSLAAEQQAANVLIDLATRDSWLTVSWHTHAPATACEPEPKAPPATEILVHLPGDEIRSLPAAGTSLDDPATTPCGGISLSRPQSALREPTDPAPAPLTFQVAAPATVQAGEEFVFEVEVTNAGAQPFTWGDECPGYNVDLHLRDAPPDVSPLHDRWTLHCGPIATLAPDQSVPFEMRFTIPADTPEGEYALYWSLVGPAFTTSLEKPAPAAIVRVLPRP